MVRIIFKLTLIFSLLVQTQMSVAQSIGPVQGDYALGLMTSDTNFVKNPIAEKNDLYKTTNDATLVRDTDSADALFGKSSWLCDASAQNGYCEFELKTITHPFQSGNCAAYGIVKGDATKYKFQLLDGSSNVLNQTPILGNYSEWTIVEASYPCGSSRKVRLTQTESGTGAAVNIGVNYGRNQNVKSITQAVYLGGIENVGNATCSYNETTSTSLSNFIDLGTGTSCNSWTADTFAVANGISAQGTNDHRLVMSTIKPGAPLKFEILGTIFSNGAGDCLFRLTNGTDTTTGQAKSQASGDERMGSLHFSIVPTVSSGTWKIQAADNGPSCGLRNDANVPLAWKVYRYPSQDEQVVRMNCSGAACGTNVFSAKVSSGNAVSNSSAPFIASCSGTTTKTCTFITNTFSVAPNCVVVTSSGGDGINAGNVTTSTTTLAYAMAIPNVSVQNQDAQIICHRVGTDQVTANMPLIAGGVTSGISGTKMKIDGSFGGASAGNNCTSTPCTLRAGTDPSVTSVTRTTTGQYTINVTSGVCSGALKCAMSAISNGSSVAFCSRFAAPTATTYNMACQVTGALDVEADFQCSCDK